MRLPLTEFGGEGGKGDHGQNPRRDEQAPGFAIHEKADIEGDGHAEQDRHANPGADLSLIGQPDGQADGQKDQGGEEQAPVAQAAQEVGDEEDQAGGGENVDPRIG